MKVEKGDGKGLTDDHTHILGIWGCRLHQISKQPRKLPTEFLEWELINPLLESLLLTKTLETLT